MDLLRTELETFTEEDILKAIKDYEAKQVPMLAKLWRYYKADDPTIMDRDSPDKNSPDNKTVVSYGRTLVKTFQGYGYRPGYITYKSEKEKYLQDLRHTFAINDEKVKTSRTGRNTAVYGVAYELFYVDGEPNAELGVVAEPRFINIDPQTMIVYYGYEPDPKIHTAIRYYPITEDRYRVEVYTPTEIIFYDREKSHGLSTGWKLTETGRQANQYGEVPVVAYYLGDEMIGIIEPVHTLVDDYDLITSDSMNEFDRFSNAYLLLKGFALAQQTKKEGQSFSRALSTLKRRRVFENLKDTDDVKFLLKDTPKDFIAWLAELVREEIHKQSHVPDFMSEKLSGATSGVAVARMMFDFENLVSSAEGDFDIALMERIRLITVLYTKANRKPDGEPSDIVISHKRNVPLDVKEFAETAVLMQQAGFSRELIAEMMPDDIIPDTEVELERQVDERTTMFGDTELPEGEVAGELSETEDVQKQALNGAQMKSMGDWTMAVSAEELAPESAKALLLIAVPGMTSEQANDIIDPAVKIEKPPPPPVPPQFGGPQAVPPEPPEAE